MGALLRCFHPLRPVLSSTEREAEPVPAALQEGFREKLRQCQLKDAQLKQNLTDEHQQFDSPLCHSPSCTKRQDSPVSEILRALEK